MPQVISLLLDKFANESTMHQIFQPILDADVKQNILADMCHFCLSYT